jgi:SNF2 family DNA or RNA helicase
VVVDGTPIDEAALQRAAESATSLIDVGGRWVQIDRDDARRALENLAEHRRDHTELNAIDLLRLAAELDALDAASDSLAGEAADESSDRVLRTTEGWADLLLRGLPDDTLREGLVPDGFTATLRPYQRRGLGWLQFLHRLGLGGCLADDMGLGKTPTTLAHLAGLPGPHLVVCPLSVVRNWQRETARFAPDLRVLVHHGSDRADAASLPLLLADHDLVVTTYQVATRDVEVLRAVAWQCVVLDEAQAVKNPATHTAKAMRRLPAAQHIALTGTPVENRLSELWSILDTVAPGLLGNQQQFRRRFVVPIERHHDPVATAALRQLTSPFLLRRTKADRSLVPDLPDKVEQIAWAPLTREQATMYQAVVDQLLLDAENASGMRRRGLVLAALTRLKQICNHPAHALGDGSRLAGRSGKLARFDELITDLHEVGEQALVFTQFREMGLLLQRHLLERFGQHTPFLHGGVSKAARDRMVDTFQAGDGASPLLLVSLKAGGTGLNLTAASRVVHYDRWWNPAVEDQATDRAWRIGQQQAVFVHKLVCQGTIEERVDTLINDKRALADAVVGTTGETWLSELSTDELRDLVVLDHALRPT